MAFTVPNGAVVEIGTTVSTAKTISAVSNANPAVATFAAGHSIVTGDLLIVASGWSKVTERVIKAGTVTTNDVPFLGIDSTLTDQYPAGGGAGSAKIISAWTQINQVIGSTSSGGEQQFTTYQPLEADTEKRIPTNKSAFGLSFTIGDDPTLAGYQAMEKANDDGLPRAIRIRLKGNSIILYYAYVSVNKTPSLTVNQVMTVTANLSLLGEPMRY